MVTGEEPKAAKNSYKSTRVRASIHYKTFAQVKSERKEANLKLIGVIIKAIVDAGDLSCGFDGVDTVAGAYGIKKVKRKPAKASSSDPHIETLVH